MKKVLVSLRKMLVRSVRQRRKGHYDNYGDEGIEELKEKIALEQDQIAAQFSLKK